MKTLPPPLSIDNYFVDELYVRALQNDKPAAPQCGDVGISFDIMKNQEAPMYWIMMTIVMGADEKSKLPYHIKLVLSGFYHFPDDLDQETTGKYLSSNALVILYGIARGIIGQATATSRYGKCVLPAVNFVEIVQKKLEEHKAPKAKGTKKSVRA